jgi:DNA modification methylase
MYKIHQGDSAIVLRDEYPENYFYSSVVDPPHLIKFLGRKWDRPKNDYRPVWREAYRTLRPGAYLMAFASPRTYHRIASQIEECGFDIKDLICWVYGQGFAKAQDIGKSIDRLKGAKQNKVRVPVENCAVTRIGHVGVDKPWIAKAQEEGFHEIDDNNPVSPEAREWAAWKTALKPAHEPIVVAQKPIEGIDGGKSIARNVLKYGTGGMDIDGNRVPFESDEEAQHFAVMEVAQHLKERDGIDILSASWGRTERPDQSGYTDKARAQLAEDSGIDMTAGRYPCNIIGEIEEHQRYFYNPQYDPEIDFPAYVYCPKVNSEERDAGMPDGEENDHPTLKPISLLRYLTRLITPKGGRVLDCFMGAGSQGVACLLEGYDYCGIELMQSNFERAEQKLWHWNVVNRALDDIPCFDGNE